MTYRVARWRGPRAGGGGATARHAPHVMILTVDGVG